MNLVLVEDHPLVREIVRHVCDDRSGWRIVGETGSGAEAVKMIARLRPDAVVLDLSLDDLNGFIVAERARAILPALRILVLTCWLNEYALIQIKRLRVQGFIYKGDRGSDVLREALGALAAGRTYFSEKFWRLAGEVNQDPQAWDKILSDTEQRIVSLIVHGMSDEEIGVALGIATMTAQKHRSHILRRVECDGTRELIALAQCKGFGLGGKEAALELQWPRGGQIKRRTRCPGPPRRAFFLSLRGA